MAEPKICRRCHQPVRPSEPQVDTGHGNFEHLHCFQGIQRTPPPASPSPEPDAPLSAELRKRAKDRELFHDYTRDGEVRLEATWEWRAATALDDLQAANAKLRARAEKAEADWRSAVALINVLKGGENTAIRERDEARQLAAGAAEKGWRTFWKAFGDHLHLQSEQRVYGWHDLMNACEKGMDAVKADLANGAP